MSFREGGISWLHAGVKIPGHHICKVTSRNADARVSTKFRWEEESEVIAMDNEKTYASAPLLSPAEAAKYLGVGRRIIYQLIEQGRLSAVKVGKALRIEKKSLDEFRDSGGLT